MILYATSVKCGIIACYFKGNKYIYTISCTGSGSFCQNPKCLGLVVRAPGFVLPESVHIGFVLPKPTLAH
jgi:hypothetical protein